MAEKIKRHNFTSPKGVFVFPKLNEPDTKFKVEGEYSVKLRLSADDPATKALIAKLAPLHKQAIEAGNEAFAKLKPETKKKLKTLTVNDLFVTCLDKETEEPTGEIEFKFGMKASGETKFGPKAGKKWTRKPGLFDAKGAILTKAPDIWGGTIGKVSFTVAEGGYFIPGTGSAGLTLSLEAAQIIELRSGGARSAKDHGFGEEEGYEADSSKPEDEDAPFSDESANEAGSAESGDF